MFCNLHDDNVETKITVLSAISKSMLRTSIVDFKLQMRKRNQ